MAEAANPAGLLRELACICLEQPLAERLTEALDAMQPHMRRMGAVAGALMTSGHRGERAEHRGQGAGSRAESMAVIRDALTDLMEPDHDALRLPVDVAAETFMFISMSAGRAGVSQLGGAVSLACGQSLLAHHLTPNGPEAIADAVTTGIGTSLAWIGGLGGLPALAAVILMPSLRITSSSRSTSKRNSPNWTPAGDRCAPHRSTSPAPPS
ncbi:hypothetical protein [Nonomuraea sp. NPDC005501]|uniref:hypothetical protein n=1 Tax=Nonomuraea sp. NPDC005501 TaxID=3156884 RepID=UPI0033A6EBB8